MKTSKLLLLVVMSFFCGSVFAQNITATLLDESNGEPLGFATVSLTKDGATKPTKYVLSSEKGVVKLESVKAGTYQLKAELLGYLPYTKTVVVKNADIALGEIKLKVDSEQLDAASISAVGNPVVIKKDTIEYNATSFKTTDNDALEDLLKKLPGVEVSENGTVTVNGESVSKITIDGKTFFLNDPQIATKNIPAKLVNKLKVIRKKSEQAEFTGIDDGNEETVIDLSVKPGMMKGITGNVQAGAGYDIPSQKGVDGKARYLGNAFIGRFSDKTQISLILNGNNTNGEGSTNRSMGMMRGMRGGGMGGGGITTSYGAGLNIAGNAFDNKMEAGGNYFYNYTNNDVENSSSRTTYLQDHNLIYDSNSLNSSTAGGHRIGMRIEHKFSESTSILFEPDINFGTGSFANTSSTDTYNDNLLGSVTKVNDAYSNNSGANKNASAGGFFLFRQRLGLPGRTLTANVRFNLSNNAINETNNNVTNTYGADEKIESVKEVRQSSKSDQDSYSINTNITYTEPLGDSFYLQANYGFNWSKSSSDKTTYDFLNGGMIDYNYSNNIVNINRRQEIGLNALYQDKKYHGQVGFSAMPNYTYNSTTRYNATTKEYIPKVYEDNRWNFSPQVSFFAEPTEKVNFRLFYRGNSAQPSTQQLMPVPDNTDPLNISFGNPYLTPYFNHNINGDIRFSNRQTFTSFNIRFNGGFTQNPIVNTNWYGTNGGQYTMPFNGPTSGNAGLNMFANLPFGQSAFSMNVNGGVNWSTNSSYVGTNVDMSTYTKDGFYAFMEEFYKNFNDPSYYAAHITQNTTNSLRSNGRVRFTYRGEAVEVNLSGSTNMNRSWYSISTMADRTTTWNNSVSAEFTWNWNAAGMQIKADGNYNWYNGYTTEQPSRFLVNASINKNFDNFTLALRGSDLLGQSKSLSVTDNANFHNESLTNTLGRYVILSFTYRFGSMGGGRRNRGGMGGPGMGGPGMMGGMGGGMGRGRM